MDRILDTKALLEIIPVTRATIRRWERAKKFPPRIRFAQNKVGWLESEISTWISEQRRGLA